MSWFDDRYFRIDAFAADGNEGAAWVIRHHGPSHMSFVIHDWLVAVSDFEVIRWQTREFRLGHAGSLTPW